MLYKIASKLFLWIGAVCIAVISGCSTDQDIDRNPEATSLKLRFSHSWDAQQVSKGDFNTLKYTNAHQEEMSIELLRYLISNVSLENEEGEVITIDDYHLIDLQDDSSLMYRSADSIPLGTYKNLWFTFGFDNDDNRSGVYADLNTALWNVPEMMGGGYHYMQLEGKFLDSTQVETGYQFHAIRAVDNSSDNPVFEDTFFKVSLGQVTIDGSTELQIDMNIAEWFKNPNEWNLNDLHSMLMPNFDAQVMMYENGKDVFKLKSD